MISDGLVLGWGKRLARRLMEQPATAFLAYLVALLWLVLAVNLALRFLGWLP